MTMKKITAGRDMLGEFAPKFAQLNDDVLFGEVWSRESELSARDRSLVTVTALMAQGLTDTSFGHHLQMAKENGITRSEIAEILTHAAFYAGWPKAWAAFRMAKDIWADAENTDEKQLLQNSMVFPIGAPNDGFAQYFSGQSYLAPVSTEQVKIFNVTFEPGCRNNWHIHEADKGGGQILICVAGHGYYQEWGKEPQELHPGDVINIMPGVKHWHGAAPDSWFSHLAVEVPGENCRSRWCEPVSEEEYRKTEIRSITMSILFINGSPNKNGNTAKLAAELLKGHEYETLNLTDYTIGAYGQNLPGDGLDAVIGAMKQADTIVIGSPLYWHNICGSVRNVLDRFYGKVEDGELSGRKLYFVFQGAAPEKWMLDAGEYTMKRFAGLYGMTYGGMATNENGATKLGKNI